MPSSAASVAVGDSHGTHDRNGDLTDGTRTYKRLWFYVKPMNLIILCGSKQSWSAPTSPTDVDTPRVIKRKWRTDNQMEDVDDGEVYWPGVAIKLDREEDARWPSSRTRYRLQ